MDSESIKKRLKRLTATIPHIRCFRFGEVFFGICWECTQCGSIRRELEEYK